MTQGDYDTPEGSNRCDEHRQRLGILHPRRTRLVRIAAKVASRARTTASDVGQLHHWRRQPAAQLRPASDGTFADGEVKVARPWACG